MDGGTPSAERMYMIISSLGYRYLRPRSIQIIFFSVIASKVKENANGARTFLEIVKARFGTSVHIMFTVSTEFIALVWYTI